LVAFSTASQFEELTKRIQRNESLRDQLHNQFKRRNQLDLFREAEEHYNDTIEADKKELKKLQEGSLGIT
jgi:hypothetical protein